MTESTSETRVSLHKEAVQKRIERVARAKILRYKFGYSNGQIATEMELPESAIRTLLRDNEDDARELLNRIVDGTDRDVAYIKEPDPDDNHTPPRHHFNTDLQHKGAQMVIDYIEENLDTGDYEVYLVWFSKTLQNWKACYTTTLNDNRYYEVTFNGDRLETYLDVYRKESNTSQDHLGNRHGTEYRY